MLSQNKQREKVKATCLITLTTTGSKENKRRHAEVEETMLPSQTSWVSELI